MIVRGSKPWARVTDEQVDRTCIVLLAAEARQLRAAIEATLAENAHLADGQRCTLWRLKAALRGEQ